MRIRLYPPETLRTEAQIPASKSISNRALIIQALAGRNAAEEQTEVKNLSDCDDTQVMTRALSLMPHTIDIMAAGTAMRFLTAYLSITAGTHIITGTERMRHRPIGILVDALRQLGAQIEYAEETGFPPLRITGQELKGGSLSLSGSVSSQYISALLMIAPMMEQGLTLTLTGDIVSRPYIDMTLTIMATFGAKAQWKDERTLRVEPEKYKPTPYTIENDWSASSYWYEMVALTQDPEPKVTLQRLFRKSTQGDSAIQDIFSHLGVHTRFFSNEEGVECIELTRQGCPCKHLDYDFVRQPDLAQTVVVTCVMMGITFRFTGLQSLKIKETDRLTALCTELRKLGYVLKEQDGNTLLWEGERCTPEKRPVMDTYEDHRMAMSLAPACMQTGMIEMNDPHVVSKSYPRFWEELTGFRIEKEQEGGHQR